MGKFIDMTGWKMSEHGVSDSRIQVLYRVGNDNRGESIWACKCLCGSKRIWNVKGGNLRDGHVKSCGCLLIEKSKENGESNKKYNNFILDLSDEQGTYGIGVCNNSGNQFYFDMDDYDKIKNYCWTDSYTSNNLHVLTTTINGKNCSMHQLLGMLHCDHKDRNELNNRRYNLRLCTHQENCRNQGVQSNNKSGFTGVYFSKETNKWRAQIKINNKNVMVYYGASKEEAIKARLEAEAKYYGEFSPQKYLFEEYGISDKEKDL